MSALPSRSRASFCIRFFFQMSSTILSVSVFGQRRCSSRLPLQRR